jgi:hypothetical protein
MPGCCGGAFSGKVDPGFPQKCDQIKMLERFSIPGNRKAR